MSPEAEPVLRLTCFVAVLVCMGLWESFAPWRHQEVSRPGRWVFHLALAALNTAFIRICLPLTAVGAAALSHERHWGLLGVFPVLWWVEVPVSVLMLDLILYAQHVTFHRLSWLWWIHRFHHSDVDLDVTTALRFHSLEMLLSGFFKGIVVLILGCSVDSIIVFEIVLNAMAMFNHSNVKMTEGVDRLLRRFVVTPGMHCIHHSVDPAEQQRNFGFNLTWWDHLFGTYQSDPAHPGRVRIGIAHAAAESDA